MNVAVDEVVVDRGSGLREFRPRFLANTDQIRCWVQSRCTRFSPAVVPRSASWSAMKRYPKAGSSAWMSRAASIRCAVVHPVTCCVRRIFAPLVERLGGETEHPAGHRDGHHRHWQGRRPAGRSFWERLPRHEVGRQRVASPRLPARGPRSRFRSSLRSSDATPSTRSSTPGRSTPSSTSASWIQR